MKTRTNNKKLVIKKLCQKKFRLLFHRGVDWSACELLADYIYASPLAACQDWNRTKLMGGAKQRCTPSPQSSILGPLLFNIFVNDLFLFIEKCILCNYADDSSMSHSSSNLQGVLSSLLNDCKITVEWFGNNGMKANSAKFQFMVLSPNPTGEIEFPYVFYWICAVVFWSLFLGVPFTLCSSCNDLKPIMSSHQF